MEIGGAVLKNTPARAEKAQETVLSLGRENLLE